MDDIRMIGQPVRSLQTMLRTISRVEPSIPLVVPDGIYSRNAIAAVSAFQKIAGLPVTGVVDLSTWDALREAYLLAYVKLHPEALNLNFRADQKIQPGDENMQLFVVQALFSALNRLFSNVPQVTVNGKHDTESTRAVRWLQSLTGQPETGALDMVTWHLLHRLYEASTQIEHLLEDKSVAAVR